MGKGSSGIGEARVGVGCVSQEDSVISPCDAEDLVASVTFDVLDERLS